MMVETDIITSITVYSPLRRAAILLISFVESFKTDVIVFIGLTSHSKRPCIICRNLLNSKLYSGICPCERVKSWCGLYILTRFYSHKILGAKRKNGKIYKLLIKTLL